MTFAQIIWLLVVGSLSVGALLGYLKSGDAEVVILSAVGAMLGITLLVSFTAITYQIWSV